MFEAIVFKAEDIFDRIDFDYWTKSSVTENSSSFSINSNFTDLHEDSVYGRCYTIAPSNEHIQYGIRSLELSLLVNSTVFIHTPGMFLKGSDHSRSKINVKLGKTYYYGVHYEYCELLDYGGSPCNNDKTYQIDACYHGEAEKQSLAELGCTTPFGPNKTKVCSNQTIGRKAFWTYFFIMDTIYGKNYEGCSYPCSYSIVSTKHEHTYETTSISPGTTSGLILNFEQVIQVTKSHYTYSELSLIAEIGGYVGLFLGISVNQMPYLLNVLKKILARIHSLF